MGRGRRKRWPPTIRSSLARSFTYSLSSLVPILSPLCVLLIYRAAGKCLRHSPSIVQPISLLFFLLLHLRVSSRHFLFPSPVRSPRERFAPFSAAPSPRIPHFPSSSSPNILTDSDHKESSRAQHEGKKGPEKAWNPSRMVICRCKRKKPPRIRTEARGGRKPCRSTDRDFY